MGWIGWQIPPSEEKFLQFARGSFTYDVKNWGGVGSNVLWHSLLIFLKSLTILWQTGGGGLKSHFLMDVINEWPLGFLRKKNPKKPPIFSIQKFWKSPLEKFLATLLTLYNDSAFDVNRLCMIIYLFHKQQS